MSFHGYVDDFIDDQYKWMSGRWSLMIIYGSISMKMSVGKYIFSRSEVRDGILLITLIIFMLIPFWYEVVIFINIVRYAINHSLQSCTKISNISCKDIISTGNQIRSSFPTTKNPNLRIRKYIFKSWGTEIKYKQNKKLKALLIGRTSSKTYTLTSYLFTAFSFG